MIDRILKLLASIAKDRWMHFTLGMVGALWLLAAGCLVSFPVGMAASSGGCLALAFRKERHDRRHGGVFDCVDFVVTLAGGAQVWMAAALVCRFAA